MFLIVTNDLLLFTKTVTSAYINTFLSEPQGFGCRSGHRGFGYWGNRGIGTSGRWPDWAIKI